ncbi:unnamed protein product, partial [Polarella glacialis]
ANTLLLVGAYLILEEGCSAQEAISRLPKKVLQRRFPRPWSPKPLWHDMSLTVDDCLYGLEAAVENRWVDYKSFDEKRWRSVYKTYDANMILRLRTEAGVTIEFWGTADPVTTVADPTVRPPPPKDGFKSDYEELVSSPRKSLRRFSSSLIIKSLSLLDLSKIETGFRRLKSWDLSTDDGVQRRTSYSSNQASNSGGLASPPPSLGSPKNSTKPRRASETSQMSVSARAERGDWLENVRVQRWASTEFGKLSAIPFDVVKSRGQTTMPQYGNWLKSVRCSRI